MVFLAGRSLGAWSLVAASTFGSGLELRAAGKDERRRGGEGGGERLLTRADSAWHRQSSATHSNDADLSTHAHPRRLRSLASLSHAASKLRSALARPLVAMGLLVSSLWRRLFTYKEFKICLVGLDNAGKTTILFQLHMGEVRPKDTDAWTLIRRLHPFVPR